MSGASETIVRPARASDAAAIVAMNIALAWESESKNLSESLVRPGVATALARPELCRYFVAERAGQVVGQTMVTYEWSDWRNGTFWWIQSVYVQASARQSGVFRMLYSAVEHAARSDPNVCGLRLYVHHDNASAKETYLRLGMARGGYEVFEVDWSSAITGP